MTYPPDQNVTPLGAPRASRTGSAQYNLQVEYAELRSGYPNVSKLNRIAPIDRGGGVPEQSPVTGNPAPAQVFFARRAAMRRVKRREKNLRKKFFGAHEAAWRYRQPGAVMH